MKRLRKTNGTKSVKREEVRDRERRAAAVERLAAVRVEADLGVRVGEATHVGVVVELLVVRARARAAGPRADGAREVVHVPIEVLARREAQQREERARERAEVAVHADRALVAHEREELHADRGVDEADEQQQAADVGEAGQRRDERVEELAHARRALHEPQHAPDAARAHHEPEAADAVRARRELREHARARADDDGEVEHVPVVDVKRTPKTLGAPK